MPDLIDPDALEWDADASYRVRLSVTLASGFTLGDYSGFTLTVREDPDWPKPRSVHASAPDPINDGWAAARTATGTVEGAYVVFDVQAPASPGYRRYVLDVVGVGVEPGFVRLYPTTYLTVKPGVTVRT